jgi:hypothetical protein
MTQSPDDLQRRITQLEEDNQRLREKLEPLLGGPENPCFDPQKFQRGYQRVMLTIMLPLYLLAMLVVPLGVASRKFFPPMSLAGIPLADFAGIGTRHPGIGIGVLAGGGAAFGVIAFGGLGVGVLAVGGGAIGIIAFGGGSIGLIALGGGAVGVVAVGGGACGYYALGQRGAGKYVFALNRQDDEAIEFFCRYLPRLRHSVTRPMPVIPVGGGETVKR